MIHDNYSISDGGGIGCQSANTILLNNTICFNQSDYSGGGIYIGDNSAITVINCIISDNIAPDHTNLCVDNNSTAIVHYSCIRDSIYPGQGNINLNPIFRTPGIDFHLMDPICGDPSLSPCIDAGDPTIQDFMIDCDWGLGEYRSDMGAYGGGDSTFVGIDWTPELIPDNFILSQNYPNPFNASTTIKYTLPEPSEVTITIYDITGRKVDTIDIGVQSAGDHSVSWNADKFSSGVYFSRLESLEHSSTLKMLLIK